MNYYGFPPNNYPVTYGYHTAYTGYQATTAYRYPTTTYTGYPPVSTSYTGYPATTTYKGYFYNIDCDAICPGPFLYIDISGKVNIDLDCGKCLF